MTKNVSIYSGSRQIQSLFTINQNSKNKFQDWAWVVVPSCGHSYLEFSTFAEVPALKFVISVRIIQSWTSLTFQGREGTVKDAQFFLITSAISSFPSREACAIMGQPAES